MTSTLDWELGILGWCCRNPDSFAELSDTMKEFHFQTEPLKKVWTKLLAQFEHHGKFPVATEIPYFCRKLGMEPATQQQILEWLDKAYTMELSDFTAQVVTRWVASREMFELGMKLQEFSQSEGDEFLKELPQARERIEKIEQLHGDKKLGESFTPLRPGSLGKMDVIEEWYGADPLPWNISRLDAKIRDGGIRAHTTLIVGPSGAGKTTLALHLVWSALALGRRVVYYAVDDNPGELTERMYAYLLLEPFVADDWKGKEEQLERILAARLKKEFPGDFWGEHIYPYSCKPQAILRDLRKLKRQFYLEDRDNAEEMGIPESEWGAIDLVVVDTADQLQPHKEYQQEHKTQERMFEELGVGAQLFKCPWVLTVQANQESVGAGQLTMRNTGGAYGKNKAAKLVLGFAQTFAQTHMPRTLTLADGYVRDNLSRMPAYHSERDHNTEWTPWWLCVNKNTRARSTRGGAAPRNIKIPMLMDGATCRLVEDFSICEEAILADKKTQREEKEAAGGPPNYENSKKGVK